MLRDMASEHVSPPSCRGTDSGPISWGASRARANLSGGLLVPVPRRESISRRQPHRAVRGSLWPSVTVPDVVFPAICFLYLFAVLCDELLSAVHHLVWCSSSASPWQSVASAMHGVLYLPYWRTVLCDTLVPHCIQTSTTASPSHATVPCSSRVFSFTRAAGEAAMTTHVQPTHTCPTVEQGPPSNTTLRQTTGPS